MADEKAWLTVTVPHGEPIEFPTSESVRVWIEKERGAWEWIKEQSSDIWNRINKAYGKTVNAATDATAPEALKTTFENELAQHLIPSELKKGKDLLLYKDTPWMGDPEGATVAFYAYCQSTGFAKDIPSVAGQKELSDRQKRAIHLGRLLASILELGIRPFDEKTWRTSIDEVVNAENDRLQKKFEEHDEKLKQAQEQNDTYTTAIADLKKNHAETLKTAEDELEKLQNTYLEKIKLEAPVKYWEDRTRDHKKEKKKALGWFGGSAGITVVIAVVWYWWQVDPEAGKVYEQPAFFILALGVVMSVWVTKQFLRGYHSNYHLELDATERKTVVETYLALLRENNAVTDNERQLVLATIFRTASTGMIKDDAGPPMSLELLRGFMMGKGGG